ncbi:hypothetical protein L0152_28125, partial [bacterium]|nr:hypothetical protein [bacterium]
MLAGVEWDIQARAQANAKKPGTNGKPKGDFRSKYLWVVQRSDNSKKHELVLPWVTNLKSATFKTVTAIEIDDDPDVAAGGQSGEERRGRGGGVRRVPQR